MQFTCEQILCAKEMPLHGYHHWGPSRTRAWMIGFLKITKTKTNKQKNPPKILPPTPTILGILRAKKAWKTSKRLLLYSSEVGLFICLSFRWFVLCSCGRTGCELQSQGYQRVWSADIYRQRQHKLTPNLLTKWLSEYTVPKQSRKARYIH